MSEDAILRLKTMTKNSEKGLTFGDRNNNNLESYDHDDALITWVNGDNNEDDNDDQEHPYELEIEDNNIDNTPPLQDPTSIHDHLEEQDESEDEEDDGKITGVDLANTEDEVPPPESEEDTESEDEQGY